MMHNILGILIILIGTLQLQVMGLLGYCLSQSGRSHDALQAYRMAKLTMPDELQWQLGEATALMELNELEEAESIYKYVLKVSPERVGIWANLANVNLRQGNQIYKRRRSQLAGQERDALIHDLTSLSSEVRSWRDESIYIENLLSDFRKNLEMQSLLLNLVWPSNLSSLTKKLKIQFTLILP